VFEARSFYGASKAFVTGQLNTETPQHKWTGHSAVIGGIVQSFRHVSVDRFHIGDNYLLWATDGVTSRTTSPVRTGSGELSAKTGPPG